MKISTTASNGLIGLLALMCGVSIASAYYYAQPLLGEIGRAFGMPDSVSGAIPMDSQLGIAIGALLFLPLFQFVAKVAPPDVGGPLTMALPMCLLFEPGLLPAP